MSLSPNHVAYTQPTRPAGVPSPTRPEDLR